MFSTCVCGTRCTCADFWLRRPASVAGTRCRSDHVSGHCCRGQGRVFSISSLGDGGGGSRRGSRQGWHRRSFRLVDAVGELVHDANRVAGTQREVGFRSSLYRRWCRRWLVTYPPSTGGGVHCGWRLHAALRRADRKKFTRTSLTHEEHHVLPKHVR